MRDAGEIARKLVATIMRDDEATNDEVADRIAAAIREARAEAFEAASRVSSDFCVKTDRSIHPDIPRENMRQEVRTAAHITAQQIAFELSQLAAEARGEAGR